jgi:hypothetical protein
MGTLVLVMIAPVVWLFINLCFLVLWEGDSVRSRYEVIRNYLFFNGTFTFFNETYIVLLTCCTIGTLYLKWDTPGNFLNSSLALVLGGILVLYPIVIAIFYSRPFIYKKILSGDKQQESRFGYLIKPFNFKRRGKQVLTYLTISLIRRLSLVITVVYM